MASDDEKKGLGCPVGYGKPPMNTRFKKGQSGNLKGRPKGTLNMSTVVARTLREQVVINEGGQRKTVAKLEAAVKQLINKAASGDLGALRLLFTLVQIIEPGSQETSIATTRLDDADQKVLMGMLKRFKDKLKGGPDK